VSGGALIIVIAVLALVWLLLIRPSKRRQVAQVTMLDSLAPGDEILTAGGVYGYVRSIDDDEVIVEIAPETTIRLAKRAVAAIIPPETDNELAAPVEEPAARSEGRGSS
jgi:preprotein translocase subunit YajC